MSAAVPTAEAADFADEADDAAPPPGPAIADAADAIADERTPPPRSSTATIVIAVVAVILALAWGRRLAVPLVAGVMLTMLLAPAVAALGRTPARRYAATVAMLGAAVATIALASWAFGGQLLRVTDRVPELLSLAAEKLEHADGDSTKSMMARLRGGLLELDRAATRWSTPRPARQRSGLMLSPPKAAAAAAPGAAAASAASAAPAASAASAASSATPITDTATTALRATAVNGTGVVVAFTGDLVIIFFVAFFLLAGGPALAGRFIDLWGPEPSRRARAGRALAECSRQVRLYAWVLLAANAAIGLVVWALFSATGLPDAAGWGVAASVLHLVPYLGMAALTALGAAEAFIAHGTLAAAAGIAAAVVVVSVLIGTIGTAVMQGRAARMSPAAVFIGLVFWGALWGLWGMFLGPALIVALKVVAENMASGQRLARVLQG